MTYLNDDMMASNVNIDYELAKARQLRADTLGKGVSSFFMSLKAILKGHGNHVHNTKTGTKFA